MLQAGLQVLGSNRDDKIIVLYCIVDANKNTDKHYERTRERFVNKVDRNYTEIR